MSVNKGWSTDKEVQTRQDVEEGKQVNKTC